MCKVNLHWEASWPDLSLYALENVRILNFQNRNVIFHHRHIYSVEEKLWIPLLERVDIDSSNGNEANKFRHLSYNYGLNSG